MWWIGCIKAVLCREGKVRATAFQHRGFHRRKSAGLERDFIPVSSSPWLLSEKALVAMSSEVMQSSLSAPSSSSCSRSLSEDRPPRAGTAASSCLRRKGGAFLWNRCFRAMLHVRVPCTHPYLSADVAPGGEPGLCRSRQSRSLMLIVSSGASRHTKMQLMK